MSSVSCGNGKLHGSGSSTRSTAASAWGLVWENEEKSIFRILEARGQGDHNREEDAALFKVPKAGRPGPARRPALWVPGPGLRRAHRAWCGSAGVPRAALHPAEGGAGATPEGHGPPESDACPRAPRRGRGGPRLPLSLPGAPSEDPLGTSASTYRLCLLLLLRGSCVRRAAGLVPAPFHAVPPFTPLWPAAFLAFLVLGRRLPLFTAPV